MKFFVSGDVICNDMGSPDTVGEFYATKGLVFYGRYQKGSIMERHRVPVPALRLLLLYPNLKWWEERPFR